MASPLKKRKLSFSSSNGSLTNDSYSYKAKNDDAGVELIHKKKVRKAGLPLNYKQLIRVMCPPLRSKYTYPSYIFKWTDNQEFVSESLCLHKKLLLDLKRLAVAHNGRTFATTLSTGDGGLQPFQFKFNGGKFKYRVMNTCMNTVHIEFREYKMKKGLFKDKGLYTTESPLRIWNRDQSNVVATGQTPQGPVPLGIMDQLTNESYLQTWSVANTTLCDIENGEQINAATIPVGKRPTRMSIELKRMFDKGSTTKVTLHPGQSFVYEVAVDPFYMPSSIGQSLNISSDDEIQFYTRIVQIFCKSQFNHMDIDTQAGPVAPVPPLTTGEGDDAGALDTPANVKGFCPGPGQVHLTKEFDIECVPIPTTKFNNVIEGSYGTSTAGEGPFVGIDSDYATHMDADSTQIPQNFYSKNNYKNIGQVRWTG